MRQPVLVVTLVVAVVTLSAGGAWAAQALVDDATPVVAADRLSTLTMIEHNDNETLIDLGEPGPSVGDMLVWGPNPLFDTNGGDTGATTQGTCVSLNDPDQCLAQETVIFADGSTLEIQGVERGDGLPSRRTVVAGSGIFFGTSGTVTVTPTSDEREWTKTFVFVSP
jgi:hypothetical protein